MLERPSECLFGIGRNLPENARQKRLQPQVTDLSLTFIVPCDASITAHVTSKCIFYKENSSNTQKSIGQCSSLQFLFGLASGTGVRKPPVIETGSASELNAPT